MHQVSNTSAECTLVMKRSFSLTSSVFIPPVQKALLFVTEKTPLRLSTLTDCLIADMVRIEEVMLEEEDAF